MTMAQSKALVTKKRTVHTYAELWHASHCVLEAGRRERCGSSWQFLSSAILTAFAFEAYMNHAGSKIIGCWKSAEQLPPLSKLELLSEFLKARLPQDKGKRPLETIVKLFAFRNSLAHGRTETISAAPIRRDIDAQLDGYLGNRPLTHWEALIKTDAFAQRAREDVEAILRIIHDTRPEPKEALFAFGIGVHSATAQARAR